MGAAREGVKRRHGQHWRVCACAQVRGRRREGVRLSTTDAALKRREEGAVGESRRSVEDDVAAASARRLGWRSLLESLARTPRANVGHRRVEAALVSKYQICRSRRLAMEVGHMSHPLTLASHVDIMRSCGDACSDHVG